MAIPLEKLPQPDADAKDISSKLTQHIQHEINTSGPINFARYMELALYAPGMGYYSAGAQKFGEAGDFITAPELSPRFGQCIAKQVSEVLTTLDEGDVLEFGAGSGRLAVDVLTSLAELGNLPNRYYILEVSASLKARQQTLLAEKLPELIDRVIWLDALPDTFTGVVLANEVLDAMPVHRFCLDKGELKESFVDWDGTFIERFDTASVPLQQAIENLGIELDDGYASEMNMMISPWIASLSACLKKGLILLIDYGFPKREYYHPQRHMGTLRCHYRHHAHDDPFLYPGLQDITAHVDFTEVADNAIKADLNVAGYTTQAHFLMGCGLMEMVDSMGSDVAASYQDSQAIKKLVLPSEMGELFKVIALTREVNVPLSGFALQDMRHKL